MFKEIDPLVAVTIISVAFMLMVYGIMTPDYRTVCTEMVLDKSACSGVHNAIQLKEVILKEGK